MNEERLEKRKVSLISEYYLDRDWIDERPWDEARRSVDDEIKQSIGWPR